MRDLLINIRLSWFFFIFFFTFLGLALWVEGVQLPAAALTLFSVNSLLFGFFILPTLASQRNRIDELAKAIRAEANGLFDILIKTKKLRRRSRNLVQGQIEDYITAAFRERRPGAGEEQYEQLIEHCLAFESDDKQQMERMDKILTALINNQQNRSQVALLLGNRVYNNEWWIMLVLFSITLGYILMILVPDVPVMYLIKALLCTGISMLLVSLLKLSTLTHKKARDIWKPLDNLKMSRFRRLD